MDSSALASGDDGTPKQTSPRFPQPEKLTDDDTVSISEDNESSNISKNLINNITPQMIDDNEIKLKERISQCKTIIESLKLQLYEEKEKMHNENRHNEDRHNENRPNKINPPKYTSGYNYHMNSSELNADELGTTSLFSASVDSKLICDESLIEYEKQLQKYQNTLNMAQNEKKNAIRKQMLAKAFKLKLMEVENQCNIELLRVKQSLQCLEPLQMIANKWQSNTDENTFDADNFEMIQNVLELKPNSNDDSYFPIPISFPKLTLDKETGDGTKEESTF